MAGYRPVVFATIDISGDHRHARAIVADHHVRELSAGHFPDDPFVPGAYIADWMVELAQVLLRAAGREPGPWRIERCVFGRKVVPGAVVSVEAELDETGSGRVRARVESAAQSASRAVVWFTELF